MLASLVFLPVFLPQTEGFAPVAVPRETRVLLNDVGRALPPVGELGPVADVDGDGDPDVLRPGGWLENDGQGHFQGRRSPWDAAPRVAFDANGDGHADFLSGLGLWLGDGTGSFTRTLDLEPGFTAEHAVAADFDLDGDLDLYVSFEHAFSDPGLSRLYANDGSGSFSPVPLATPLGGAAFEVAIPLDFDADLDPDLAVLSSGFGRTVSVWRNDGAAGFVEVFTLPLPGCCSYLHENLAVADFDGDGHLDLAASVPPSVWLGDGSFGFTELPGSFPALPPAELRTGRFLSADWEGDGDEDLILLRRAVAQSPCGTVQASDLLLENDGTGTFSVATSWPERVATTTGGAIADLDGDGDVDLLVEALEGNHLILNDGAAGGASAEPNRLLRPGATGYEFNDAVAGNLNADPYTDVLTTQNVYLGTAEGSLVHAGTVPGIPYICGGRVGFSLGLADLDGDGDLDGFAGNSENGPGQPVFYENDGAGGFSSPAGWGLGPGAPTSEIVGILSQLHAGDLDGDGDQDLLYQRNWDNDGSGSTTIWLNDGAAVFTVVPGTDYLGSHALGVARAGALADFDDDGDLDHLSGARLPLLTELFRNDGTAHFTQDADAVPPTPLEDVYGLEVADVDGDGDLDAIALAEGYQGTNNPDVNHLYLNDGTGVFTDEPFRLPQVGPFEGRFGDLDGDGDLDLVGTELVYPNDGTGDFTGQPRPLRGLLGDGPLADLDRDGDLDRFVTSSAEERVVPNLRRHVTTTRARLGKVHRVELYGAPGQPFVLLEALASAEVDLGAPGTLLVAPLQVLTTTAGILGPDGRRVFRRGLAADPALLGQSRYYQAFLGSPARLTNLARTDISDL